MAKDLENWRPVPNFPRYEVSDFGRVRNIQTGRELKPADKRGYLGVTLYGEDAKLQIGVHRLVASAFIPNPACKEQVNHIDGDKRNNKVGNLEWATPRENTAHAWAVLGRRAGMTGKHHSPETREKLKQARLGKPLPESTRAKMRESAKKLGDSHRSRKVKNLDTGEVFDCITSAAEKYGGRRNISQCCLGKRKTSGGYRWAYV